MSTIREDSYSALGYLTSFPIDVVKIDKSFIDQVETDPMKSAIVSAVINLSRAIGGTTIAEGVERSRQLERLGLLGPTHAQGYYFAEPASAEAFASTLMTSASELIAKLASDASNVLSAQAVRHYFSIAATDDSVAVIVDVVPTRNYVTELNLATSRH